MSNSTPTFDSIAQSQAAKEVTANAYFDAASPATIYGRRQSASSGLTWGYYGGYARVNGGRALIANGTLTLTANSVCYVEANPSTGAISFNTAAAFTPGFWPLYQIVTGASTVTSWTDYRLAVNPETGRNVLAMTDANQTLVRGQADNGILEFTGTLTAQRNIIIPLIVNQYIVYNGTTGGFGLQFIGATGTGVVVAATKRAIIYADGTNVVRATADV